MKKQTKESVTNKQMKNDLKKIDINNKDKEIYFYQLEDSGNIIETKGYIKNFSYAKDFNGRRRNVLIFKYTIEGEEETSKNTFRTSASSKEGIIYRNNLWLYESDIKKAAEIFLEYKLKKLEALKKSVEDMKKIIHGLYEIINN